MARYYQRKLCLDGTVNPQFRADTRKGDRHRGARQSGAKLTKWDRGQFVAWDSEGANINGAHEMVLLLSSAGDSVVDPNGIDTESALRVLTDGLFRESTSIHVIFAGGYDVNMLLRDVDREDLRYLWSGAFTRFTVGNSVFRARYIPRKQFTIHRLHGNKWLGGTLWDVFGLFQSSFLKALKSWGIGGPDYELIEWGKAHRSEFRPEDLQAITRYTQAELRCLVALMERVRAAFIEADLKVARWDGAGAIAAALLRKYGVKEYRKPAPDSVIDAARHAYFGGRIELIQYGHHSGPLYIADIRSAYPWAATTLPCLKHGQWKHIVGNGWSANPFTLYHIRFDWESGASAYPLPWRAKDGAVYFPPRGEGWYWSVEADCAFAFDWPGNVEIIERYEWQPSCNHMPFSWLHDVYNIRKHWNASGKEHAGKVLKLGINSVYGKLAQQVGSQDGKIPAHHELTWAGWITASTRAKLWRAAAEPLRLGTVVAFATDAIHATAAPAVPESSELGEWEISEYLSGTYVQSGVYWYGENQTEKRKYRGLDEESLARNEVLKAWQKRLPFVHVCNTRFVGMGRALCSDRQWKLWRTWHTEKRELNIWPQGKRRIISAHDAPHKRLCLTAPADPVHERERQGWLSQPIELPWLTGGVSATEIREERKIDSETEEE